MNVVTSFSQEHAASLEAQIGQVQSRAENAEAQLAEALAELQLLRSQRRTQLDDKSPVSDAQGAVDETKDSHVVEATALAVEAMERAEELEAHLHESRERLAQSQVRERTPNAIASFVQTKCCINLRRL